MIRVEILCDWRETPGARDAKHRCASLDNATPCGEHMDGEQAAAKARHNASLAGWTRRNPPGNRNRSRMGWICDRCRAREGEA